MATWPRCLVYVGDSPSNEMGAESDGELRRDHRHLRFYRPEIGSALAQGEPRVLDGEPGKAQPDGRKLAKPVSLTGLVGSNPTPCALVVPAGVGLPPVAHAHLA